MKTLHNNYCNSKQGYLPLFLSDCLDLLDPVLTFDRLMGGIDLNKYLTDIPEYTTGRLRYNPVNMLKTVLFGFMTSGYCSLRELEDNCKVNIRFMYLMDHQTPSYRTFGYFINEILQDKIENIFNDINHAIFNDEHVDLQHLYIDGSKFEANANKYTWVWKKATEKFRYKLYEKITAEIEEINAEIAWSGVQITTNPEYVPDYLNEIVEQLVLLWELDTSTFVYGSGKRKSKEQRHYEHLTTFCQKLQEYIQKIEICGPNRNSYSKTDNSATFMRIKTDYMGNDQLLPAYNVQIGVADEYIAVVDVNHYRSDMDCFVPLMEHFKQTYGFYPKYPVADAGYGSYNNYIFCEQNGIEKYMKFPMFKKETKDRKYHEDPFRAVNFRIDEQGVMRCPNDKAFHFLYRKNVRGNQYGRKEELYECEDCSGCPYAEKCKKTDKNRTVRINQELTSMHQEVIENLESIHGALLRMNRSIQAEGTFGIMKNDRWYTLIGPKGLSRVVNALRVIAPELPFEINMIELNGQQEHLSIKGYEIDAFRVNHAVTCYGYTISIPRIGKFNADKAKELGIPCRIWNKLQHGQEIEYEGITYTPDMVMGAPRKGIKLTYCTDTRPVQAIVDNAKNSDLFICEGMYGEKDKESKAKEYKHMTFYEAAELAKNADVKEMWLTHYSPSLIRPADYVGNIKNIFKNVRAAKDGQSVTLNFEDEE